jgi:hypothetical protein
MAPEASPVLDMSSQSRRAPLHEHRGDCYDTPPVAVEALLRHQILPHRIWEPAAGKGNIVTVLRAHGHEVIASDLNGRGCPDCTTGIDFLFPGFDPKADCICTNPPYVLVQRFVELALERAPMVVMLMRLAFLESERRSHILEGCGLARVLVFRKRLPLMHRADWQGKKANSGMAFCWLIWRREYIGLATLERISWDR